MGPSQTIEAPLPAGHGTVLAAPEAPDGAWKEVLVFGTPMEAPHTQADGERLATELFGPADARPNPWAAQSIRGLRELVVPAGRDHIDFCARHIMSSLVNSANVVDLDKQVRQAVDTLHGANIHTKEDLAELAAGAQWLDHITEYGHGFLSATGFGVASALLDFDPGTGLGNQIGGSLPHPNPVKVAAATGAAVGVISSAMDHTPGHAVSTAFADSYLQRPANDKLPPSLVAAQQPGKWSAALSTATAAAAGYGGRNVARVIVGSAMLATGASAAHRQLADSVIDSVGGPTVGGPGLRMASNAFERHNGNSGLQYLIGRSDLAETLRAYQAYKDAKVTSTLKSAATNSATVASEFFKTPILERELLTKDGWTSHAILGGAFSGLSAGLTALKHKPWIQLATKHSGLLAAYATWGAGLAGIGAPRKPDIEKLVYGRDGVTPGEGHQPTELPTPGGSAWAGGLGKTPAPIKVTYETRPQPDTSSSAHRDPSHASVPHTPVAEGWAAPAGQPPSSYTQSRRAHSVRSVSVGPSVSGSAPASPRLPATSPGGGVETAHGQLLTVPAAPSQRVRRTPSPPRTVGTRGTDGTASGTSPVGSEKSVPRTTPPRSPSPHAHQEPIGGGDRASQKTPPAEGSAPPSRAASPPLGERRHPDEEETQAPHETETGS